MQSINLILPVAALAMWTQLVLLLVPIRRFAASGRGEVGPGDFRLGESSNVPEYVSLPNRNYMNLLELPLLFYVACLTAYVTDGVSQALVVLAWAYVAFRVVHSVIHIGYNNVMHRIVAFALSNIALLAMWVLLLMHLL